MSVTLGSFYNDYTSTANDAWDDGVDDDIVEIHTANPILNRATDGEVEMKGRASANRTKLNSLLVIMM